MRRPQDDTTDAPNSGTTTPTPTPGATNGPIGQAPRPASNHAWDFGGTWSNGVFKPANGDWQAWFHQVTQALQGGANQATLRTIEQSLKDYGVQLSPENANHQITKIGLPDGTWVRVLEGDPNNGSWTWVNQGSGSGNEVLGGGGLNGPLTAPYTQQFQAPAMLDLGGPQGLSFIPPVPQFNAPAFTPPSAQQAASEPGYQFTLGQGLQAMEQAAAASGTLGTFNTAYNAGNYASGFANQHYNDVFNRALEAYNTTYRGAYDAFQPLMQQYQTLSSAGQRQNELNYGNAWDQYLQGYNAYRNWQNDAFNKLYSTSTA